MWETQQNQGSFFYFAKKLYGKLEEKTCQVFFQKSLFSTKCTKYYGVKKGEQMRKKKEKVRFLKLPISKVFRSALYSCFEWLFCFWMLFLFLSREAEYAQLFTKLKIFSVGICGKSCFV